MAAPCPYENITRRLHGLGKGGLSASLRRNFVSVEYANREFFGDLVKKLADIG
jgi:hypothetical protein